MQRMLTQRLFHTCLGLVLGAALAISVAAAPAWSAEHEAAEGAAMSKLAPNAEPGTPSTADAANKPNDVGFPQLNAKTYPSQVFWLVITFTLLYILMSRAALPRVGGVLEARREQREGNLKRAEQLQDEASKAKAAYEAALAKAQESAQEALSQAEQDISEKLAAENAKFVEQARKRIATAETNIAKAKADALSSLADISADISVEIVGKVAGVAVNKADAKKVVSDIMKKEAA